jgi:hypothetical protein
VLVVNAVLHVHNLFTNTAVNVLQLNNQMKLARHNLKLPPLHCRHSHWQPCRCENADRLSTSAPQPTRHPRVHPRATETTCHGSEPRTELPHRWPNHVATSARQRSKTRTPTQEKPSKPIYTPYDLSIYYVSAKPLPNWKSILRSTEIGQHLTSEHHPFLLFLAVIIPGPRTTG